MIVIVGFGMLDNLCIVPSVAKLAIVPLPVRSPVCAGVAVNPVTWLGSANRHGVLFA